MRAEKIVSFAKKVLGEKAKRLSKNPEKAILLTDKAREKLRSKKGRFKDSYDDLKALFRMIRHYFKGSYKDISSKTVFLGLAAILYFLMPLDMIPDFIPFTGYLDDATLLLWSIKKMGKEFAKFKEWEESREEA